MNDLISLIDMTEQEAVDFPSTVMAICHLMTLYALHPCESLASNINRHIRFILNSAASDTSGEYKVAFRQILSLWELIADQHQAAPINQQVISMHKY